MCTRIPILLMPTLCGKYAANGIFLEKSEAAQKNIDKLRGGWYNNIRRYGWCRSRGKMLLWLRW